MVRIVSRRRHVHQNKFHGLWVEFSTGEKAYIAYRKGLGLRTVGYYAKANAWCLDHSTLEHAKAIGVRWIILIHDVAKSKRHYYSTRLEDFFGANAGERRENGTRQRYLSRAFWLNSPYLDVGNIERQVCIRK